MTLYPLRLALWALAMGVPAWGVDRDQCPELCMVSGPNPSNWTNVADINQLKACQRPMVLDFSVREPITNRQRIRVCNIWANDFRPKAFEGLSAPPIDMDIKNQTVRPELAWNPATSKKEVFGRIATVSMDNLQSYLYNKPETANTTMLFATASGVTVGVYAGANLVDRNIARLFVPLYSTLNKAGLTASKSALIQVCSGRVADDTFGLVVTADQDFTAVHHAVGRWANGSCVDTSSYAERKNVNETTILVYEQPELEPANNSTSNITRSVLQARADCRTVTIVQGDLCGDLIKRCGVKLTVAEFEKLNPTKNFCNNLQVGQRACCTSGTLPDIHPKKKADGSCFAYQIKSGEYCSLIAARYGLTVKELEGFNKNTWGWNGCDYGFWPDNWMCLSDGTPPFPSPISNAVCGPQKPGTKMPSGSQSKDWAKLNPCPLKACCNIWGQCGTTADFCVDTSTGPPGTAKKDTFGCISNCGMSVIMGTPPKEFIKLGYFEGFNLGRSCLNMDASQIDPSYTHIHFAFAMLDNDFNVYHQDAMTEYQFQQFRKIKGPKRIISFGGWVFSAEAPNYQILRNAVKPENREKFTDNLVKYVVDNGLDGLDIDWEYPSAPDLPGIPPGDPLEALDYLGVMTILRRKLPKDKSLSIAAPASYWYLKQFYIEAMSRSLDYIVFMTYDLHGQWDAGNKWASPGCPSGNCLRSHINMTETVNSLAMITKAGVPSSKILVGISSYGRSFQMADPSCTGPMCLFTGDRQTSFARKGRCTKTAGYISNAEINEIKGRTFIDGSQSMIMVDGDLWVSYMDDALKQSRINTYKSLNMGGTSDWAVDLAKLYPPPPDAAKLGIGWSAFKENVLGGRGGTCPDAKNPKGAFTRKTCNDEAEYWKTAKEQWDALECKSLWYWLMQVWKGCHEGKGSMRFDYAVNSILGLRGSPQCWNMLNTGSCDNVHSCKGVPITGGHLVWNSIVGVHDLFKSYWKLLEIVGDKLSNKQEEFVTTFAPKGANGGEVVELLFSFLQIPYGIGLSRVLGSDLVKRFAPAEGARASLLESLAGMGFDTARDALASAADAREEIAFNEIFEATIASWQNQTNFILEQIFSNEGKGYNLISTLIEDGKMLAEPNGEDRLSPGSFMSTKVLDLQRAFYGAGIPMLWKADRRGPVIADFGPGCEIDARKYFEVGPSTYNVAWECINGHSYILAGVREGRQESCGIIFPDGPECPPVLQWTFDLLPGIDLLKEAGGDWQTSVREIILGAVKTYESTGKKNRLEEQVPMSTSPSDLQDFMADQNVDIGKVPGLVRIPVCSPQTAEANLKAGIDWYTEEYGSAANWPC